MLKNERDIIDVVLDEGEMVELSGVLKKILSLGNRKIENKSSIEAAVNIILNNKDKCRHIKS